MTTSTTTARNFSTSTNRRNDYCITHGHSISCWT